MDFDEDFDLDEIEDQIEIINQIFIDENRRMIKEQYGIIDDLYF